MSQVTEHDDMLAGMHPLIDVCGRKKIWGLGGLKGFRVSIGFRLIEGLCRGFRICWWDKVYLQVYTESQRSAPNLPR